MFVQMKVHPSCVALLKLCFSEFYRRTGTFKQRAIAMLGDSYGSSLETKTFLTFFSMESPVGSLEYGRKFQEVIISLN
jgi:hypothetical protein